MLAALDPDVLTAVKRGSKELRWERGRQTESHPSTLRFPSVCPRSAEAAFAGGVRGLQGAGMHFDLCSLLCDDVNRRLGHPITYDMIEERGGSSSRNPSRIGTHPKIVISASISMNMEQGGSD